jgi:hypothetical protein
MRDENVSTNLNENPEYKISQKSAQSELCFSVQTNGEK